MMRVILLGPPGVGKGTQAKLLEKKTGTPLVIIGDILRAAVQKGDAIGKEAETYMKRGDLVPDKLIIKIITNRLKEKDCQEKGFILDGFPRTIEQAKSLKKVDRVFYFSLSNEDVSVKRIEGRRVCKSCGKVYNIQWTPPKSENKCDACEGDLYQRVDDTASVIKQRLGEYHQKTAPLLDYYKKKNLLTEIPAERSIEEVFGDLAQKTESLLMESQGRGYD